MSFMRIYYRVLTDRHRIDFDVVTYTFHDAWLYLKKDRFSKGGQKWECYNEDNESELHA